MSRYRDKVMGSLLGGAIGDALGAPVEFWSRDRIVAEVGQHGVREYLLASFEGASARGLITDDTQMTLFTMEGLIAAYRRSQSRGIGFVMRLVHDAYVCWYRTQTSSEVIEDRASSLASQAWLYSRRAPGNTCMSALRAVVDDPTSPSLLRGAPAQNESKGCGAVMRTAPFGWIPCDRADSAAWIVPSALEVAAYTHGHVTGQVSAAALTLIISELMFYSGLEVSIQTSIEEIQLLAGSDETAHALREAVRSAERAPGDPDELAWLGEGWTGEEALAIAVYCALSFPNREQILDALSLAVSHGGDSDSTGAICGNILGALHGIEALPPNLLEGLEGRDAIEQMGEEFVQTFQRRHDAIFGE